MRGYATILLEYLVDACGPADFSDVRTALFGLQRPPFNGTVSFLRCESQSNLDRLKVFALVYLATNAREACEISTNFSNAAGLDMLAKYLPVRQGESRADFEARKNGSPFYNSTVVDAALDCCLAQQFVSRLFPMGHIKSVVPNDERFIAHFKQSKKWLRVTPPKSQSNF